MATTTLIYIAVFLTVLLIMGKVIGNYLARLIEGDLPHWVTKTEQVIWRSCGFKPAGKAIQPMSWYHYMFALLIFNSMGAFLLLVILLNQGYLPLNPQFAPNMSWDLALNTTISFITNTNWQAYSGETAVSYLSQMMGLTVQNFLSATTGIAVAFVLIRALTQSSCHSIGNAWVDIGRITLYLLLPLAIIWSLLFVSQGVIQNFHPALLSQGLENQQWLPMGPVASQEAIKLLGTNGGGYFAANSAHPYENPTSFSNFLQILAIFLLPTALCFAFGRLSGTQRQGYTLLWVMTLIFIVAVSVIVWAEWRGNPQFTLMGADSSLNMEGKESRFGLIGSALFVAVTTAASCGAVNAMHDSLTALGGMVPMWLMQTGEVIFGGVGSGFYGMILYVLLAVFIAGLMVGRAPEYLGKKIGVAEMKWVAVAILISPAITLLGTTLALFSEVGREAILNPGPHGFSEVLYAFTSAANNNGSAFAGLNANSVFYNLLLGITMLVGRFGVMLPVLAIAGSLAIKKRQAESLATLSTTSPLFIFLLFLTVIMIGALTFVPALALGPIAEHLQLLWAK
ncbi:TPA: potassium-transporting ATPase subunit KdpA [Proteus mirabilis]|uniref:potassium-transporting ATPase subunit KdpA n=1 Tax=Proteus mirabilis TaxID=584 RepID=UPI0013D01761|nr:potassium-transporting ATPase subunit KdpA [Proteus mirabilis]MBG2847019.1 potassium-transporting ATPase subunit KdpA [Proteus mirabilis]MBG3121467.1 potassium-transporting ATPase subunit KdpA [Proteus mirabilis]MBI6291656.1 potassium-transporting ATPase subunit KdpA [Proteus mirabilis]MBI6324504.1 potassium-transporting ATPase subunit KdpA [Proteus mirabilis]MBI6398085.1 potassium-transporting ATPase subunit KdpA [Proteus mirabilis]